MLSFYVPAMFCLNEDIKCVRFLVVDVVALHVSFLGLYTFAKVIGCPPVLHLIIFVSELLSCLLMKCVFNLCSSLVSGRVGEISSEWLKSRSCLNAGEVLLSLIILFVLDGVDEAMGELSSTSWSELWLISGDTIADLGDVSKVLLRGAIVV